MMTKLIAAMTIAAGFSMLAPMDAEAWYCRARSPSAWGWGQHPTSLSYARQRALAECAVRTPRRQVCRITSCR